MSLYIPQSDERPNNDGQQLAEDMHLEAEQELCFEDMDRSGYEAMDSHMFTDTLTLS